MVAPAVMVALMVASFAMSAVSAFSQAAQQKKMANAQRDAQAQQFALVSDAAERQQREINKQAEEQKSDRARQADQEIGALRVTLGEAGGLQTGTNIRLIQQAGYFSGMDITRIEENRQARIDALQDQKRSGALQLGTVETQTNLTKSAANTNAVLGTIGAGVQIASSYAQYSNTQAALKNLKTQ